MVDVYYGERTLKGKENRCQIMLDGCIFGWHQMGLAICALEIKVKEKQK